MSDAMIIILHSSDLNIMKKEHWAGDQESNKPLYPTTRSIMIIDLWKVK